MQEYKIIFAGNMGAGKTSAVQSLSEIDVISTDVVNTDRGAHSKLMTTVGIDYGQIILPPDVKISLYGTPGQERFEAVWRVVTQGALGAIVLIDSTSDKAKEDLPYYVDYFAKYNIRHIVIGITHTNETERTQHISLEDCFSILQSQSMVYPVFAVDTRIKEDVLLLIDCLLSSIEATMA